MTPIERTGQRFHFFPEGHKTEANNLLADLLIDVGFREVSSSSGNYGPVHRSGQVFEHGISFRKVILEEETFCAGFNVQWSEYPNFKGDLLRWEFMLYGRTFPKGFQITQSRPPPYDQGLAPHFWISKLSKPEGERQSRILSGDLSHLQLVWTRRMGTFDAEFLGFLLVAADQYIETQKVPPILALSRQIWPRSTGTTLNGGRSNT